MNSSFVANMASRNFKRFWIAGLLLLAVLLLGNIGLMSDGPPSPMGIIDHQSAGTATEVDAIQQAWQQAGKLTFAKAFMLGDLVFIGIYSFGALCGGLLMLADERPMIKRAGVLVIVATAVFFLTDYLETILQAIQLFSMQGADNSARIAAALGPTKVAAMVVTLLGLGGKLLIDRYQEQR